MRVPLINRNKFNWQLMWRKSKRRDSRTSAIKQSQFSKTTTWRKDIIIIMLVQTTFFPGTQRGRSCAGQLAYSYYIYICCFNSFRWCPLDDLFWAVLVKTPGAGLPLRLACHNNHYFRVYIVEYYGAYIR